MTFCGFPIGVKAEPTFAAIAERTMRLLKSFPPEIWDRVITKGMKISMAVSFIMTAEESATVGRRMKASFLSEPPDREISLHERRVKIPDSSSPPLETSMSDPIRERLPPSPPNRAFPHRRELSRRRRAK